MRKNDIFNTLKVRGFKMKKRLIVILSVAVLVMGVFAFIFSVPSTDVDSRGLIKEIEKYDDAWIISVLDSTDTNYIRKVTIDTKTKILDSNGNVIPLSEIEQGVFVDITFRAKTKEKFADKVKIFSPQNY
jgi:hypothetical protein